jgi:hypothetical protein
MKRWMLALVAATTGCSDDCVAPRWQLDVAFANLEGAQLFTPMDRDPSGSLTMLVHPSLDSIRVGDMVFSESQIVRVDADGRITTTAPAPDGPASGAAAMVRVNDAGATLLAWTTEAGVTLALHGPELDRRWAYGMSATKTGFGAMVHGDIGPSGEAALLTSEVGLVTGTLTVFEPTGEVRWTQPGPSVQQNRAIVFSPDGDLFVFSSTSLGPIRRRHAAATGAVIDELTLQQDPAIVEPEGGYYIVDQLPSYPVLARAGRYDAAGGQRWLLDLGKSVIVDSTRPPSGDLLVTTSPAEGAAQTLHVYEAATGELLGEAPFCGGNLLAADADAYTAVRSASNSHFVIERYARP